MALPLPCSVDVQGPRTLRLDGSRDSSRRPRNIRRSCAPLLSLRRPFCEAHSHTPDTQSELPQVSDHSFSPCCHGDQYGARDRGETVWERGYTPDSQWHRDVPHSTDPPHSRTSPLRRTTGEDEGGRSAPSRLPGNSSGYDLFRSPAYCGRWLGEEIPRAIRSQSRPSGSRHVRRAPGPK